MSLSGEYRLGPLVHWRHHPSLPLPTVRVPLLASFPPSASNHIVNIISPYASAASCDPFKLCRNPFPFPSLRARLRCLGPHSTSPHSLFGPFLCFWLPLVPLLGYRSPHALVSDCSLLVMANPPFAPVLLAHCAPPCGRLPGNHDPSSGLLPIFQTNGLGLARERAFFQWLLLVPNHAHSRAQ